MSTRHCSSSDSHSQDEVIAFLSDGASYGLPLADAFLRPGSACLIAIGGLSGVGKSSVAQALASGFPPAPGARVIRSDILRKRLFDYPPEAKLPGSPMRLKLRSVSIVLYTIRLQFRLQRAIRRLLTRRFCDRMSAGGFQRAQISLACRS